MRAASRDLTPGVPSWIRELKAFSNSGFRLEGDWGLGIRTSRRFVFFEDLFPEQVQESLFGQVSMAKNLRRLVVF